MSAAVDSWSAPSGVAPGSHSCWIVGGSATYLEEAAMLVRQAADFDEKPVVFGPEGNGELQALASLAAVVADPWRAFLAGGRLDPEAMRRMFRDETAKARREGYRALRVIADMDWLLPAAPTTEEIVGFEVLLDRDVRELGATIVCAYRRRSFDLDATTAVLCVHPVSAGSLSPPPFRLTAADGRRWQLSGEVDIAEADVLLAGLSSAIGEGPFWIDASGLEFADIAGLRAFARAARSAGSLPIRVAGAGAAIRRTWRLAGFGDAAPAVEFID